MTWIVGIVKFRNKLIHECQLKKDWECSRAVEKVLDEITRLSDQLFTPPTGNQALDGYAINDYVVVSNNDGREWQLRRQGTSNTDCWST